MRSEEKMNKRIAVLILVMLAVFSLPSVANAVIKASDYINDCHTKIYTYSGGQLGINFSINGADKMNKIGAKTIILQEQAPGSSSWTAVKTFSYTEYTGMLRNKALSHNYTVYYYDAIPGYSYKAKVYFYAENGGYDTLELTSPVVTAK